MTPELSHRSLPPCPYEPCSQAREVLPASGPGPGIGRVVRYGSFRRANDSRVIPRFRCGTCRRTFSRATRSACFRQKKRTVNSKVERLLCSGVSQRRIALVLRINVKTVTRKLLFLAARARASRLSSLEALAGLPLALRLRSLQFDEMESFERSKCLPLSIPLAVEPGRRRILGFRVCEMPANGPLAAISRRKYGRRRDERAAAAADLFTEIRSIVHPEAEIATDQNPKYPNWLKPHFPKARHRAFKGRRGCVVGQGELKKIGHDPLFSLNHTCAMLRYGISRLIRRTWSTTKKRERLEAHLEVYVGFHNRELAAQA